MIRNIPVLMKYSYIKNVFLKYIAHIWFLELFCFAFFGFKMFSMWVLARKENLLQIEYILITE